MPVKVLWRDEARHDLTEIGDEIARSSPQAASRYTDGILGTTRKLADFPLSGQEYDHRFRRLVYRNHLILYRFQEENDEVVIMTIVDARRDLDRLLSDLRPY